MNRAGPGSIPATADRVELLCRMERWSEALGLVTRLIADDPENDVAWCQLAQCRLGLGDAQGALDAAGQAAALAPDSEWPHRLVSFGASALGRHDLAVQAANEAVRIEPLAWQAHARLAAAQLRRVAPRGRFDRRARESRREAALAADRARALAPDEPQVHLIRGSVAAAQGRRDDAEAAYRTALCLDPQSSAAHHLLATLGLRARSGPRRLAAAAGGFATALTTDPTAQVSRRSLEMTLRLMLGRTAYGLFAVTYVSQVFAVVAAPWARVLPVALLGLPGLYAVAFARGLEPQLRAFGRRVLRERLTITALVLAAASAGLVVAGAAAASALRPSLAAGAALSALLARVMVWIGSRRGAVLT